MNVTIYPKPLSGHLEVVASKSLSHRYLIAASLSKGVSTLSNVLDSDDTHATKQALMSFGAVFEGNQVIGNGLRMVKNDINCNESGSTLRFMIPIALTCDQFMTFNGKNQLTKRPMSVYENVFANQDVVYKKLSNDELPILIKGPLLSGRFEVQGDVSSQFISGLLFALPLLDGKSTVNITTPLQSKDYVQMTLDVLNEFGISIQNEGNLYEINGNQLYKSKDVAVEGDFSQAAFWMVAGTIFKQISLSRLNPLSHQGDKRIVDIINGMGGSIKYDGLNYIASPAKTKGVSIDLTHIPDLGPILMILAGLSEGKTSMTGIERLKYKESDRLNVMIQILHSLGVKTMYTNQTLEIYGVKLFKGNQTFSSENDHRIAMALSIASIRASGPITIENAEAVRKSYPHFYEDFQKLGGVMDVS